MRDRRLRIRRHRQLVARAQRELHLAFGALDRLVAVGHRVGLVRVRRAVVRPFAVRGFDLQFLFALRDFQLADGLSQRVVCLNGGAVPGQRVRVVALADCRLAARHRERRSLLFVHEAADAAVRRQRFAVVFLARAVRNDLQRRRIDRQGAGHGRDRIVISHVYRAVHDLVACSNRVVPCRRIGHVGRAAIRCRNQGITRQQRTFGHRHFGVLMRTSVVRPCLARRRDRDCCTRVRHGQLAIRRRDRVVARRPGRELIAHQLVRHRALARQRDAARHYCSDHVTADQPVHVIVRPALRFASVGKYLALRRYRHVFRSDLQPAVDNRQICRDIVNKAVFGIGNRKAILGEAHWIRLVGIGAAVDVRALCFGSLSIRERHRHAFWGSLRPFAVADLILNSVAGHRLLIAVVGLCVVIAGDLDFQDRLPDGVQVMVGIRLVAGDLRHYCTVSKAERVGFLIIDQPQIIGIRRRGRSASGRPSCPADKHIASVKERIGSLDSRRHIHTDIRNAHNSVRTVVRVPVDMRLRFFADILVNGDKLDRIGVARVLLGAARIFGNLGACLQNIEGIAGQNGDAAVHKRSSVPLLHRPVGELLLFVIGDRSACSDRFRIRLIVPRIRILGRFIFECAVSGFINDRDALCADQHIAPLGIQIQGPVDPETVVRYVLVYIFLTFLHKAVLIGLGGAGLVINLGRFVIHDERIGIEWLLAGLVDIPANQLVILADRGGKRDRFAHIDTERGALRTELENIRFGNIRMQEDTVLLQHPLGIDRQAFRHVGEGILLRALIVDKPSGENIIAERGLVVIVTALIVRGHVRFKRDVIDDLQITAEGLILRIPVAINIDAVLIKKVIFQRRITDV